MKARTPVIDSLSSNGITFTNYWVNPECSPTRAAMLTGRYGFRTGVGSVAGNSPPNLNQNETIIQKYINSRTFNTYSTALVGKWHLSGKNELSEPENFGIQYFSGFLPGAVEDYYHWTCTGGGYQQTISTYTTTYFVDLSVQWMKRQTQPFFLWLAFNAPHSPFQRPPQKLITDEELSRYRQHTETDQKAYYLSSIEAMDKEIGRLIASMSKQQKDNTVFVFMGDNGTPGRIAQKPFTTNTSKSSLFQGGINTPLIVSGQGITRKNTVETAMVQATDIFATLADISGIQKIDDQDGKSIKPLFNSEKGAKRSFVYSEIFGSARAENNGYAIRNKNYKLIHLDKGKEYLFRISSDPFETSNLLDHTLNGEENDNLIALRLIKSKL